MSKTTESSQMDRTNSVIFETLIKATLLLTDNNFSMWKSKILTIFEYLSLEKVHDRVVNPSNEEDTLIIWQAIINEFASSKAANQERIWNEFSNMPFNDTEVLGFITRLRSMLIKMHEVGIVIPPNILSYEILNKFPPTTELTTIATTIQHCGSAITPTHVLYHLKLYADNLASTAKVAKSQVFPHLNPYLQSNLTKGTGNQSEISTEVEEDTSSEVKISANKDDFESAPEENIESTDDKAAISSALVPEMLSEHFLKANTLIKQMKIELSPQEVESRSQTHSLLTGYLNEVFDLIDSTIKSIQGSDWDLALKDWKSESKCLNRTLEELAGLIKPVADTMEEENEKPSKTFVRGPVINIAKLLIIIVKNSRSILDKFITLGMNTKRLPFFTEMGSDRIEFIAMLHGNVSGNLSSMLSILESADVAHGAVRGDQVWEIAKELQYWSGVPWLPAQLYIVPAIADTDGTFTQDHYNSWLLSWNTKRLLAFRNSKNYVKFLRGNRV
ncbi:hypothetical protein KEM48_008434 [Puccinia striiformis f. sp. tritici PST-130]|nr:hypothetical protein KEM48_008434 [Puccinia striiformis f. sp. tritici PST-130]